MFGPIYNYTPNAYPYDPTRLYNPPGNFYSGMNPPNASAGVGHHQSKGVLGSLADFGKGILNGAVNTVKSLFTFKGAAMAIGTLGLLWAVPAALPFLVTAGVAVGGVQLLKGITTGDWNKAGEGLFAVGASMLGAKFGPKTFQDAAGTTYSLTHNGAKAEGFLNSTWANIKSVFGGKLQPMNADGAVLSNAPGKTVYSLGKDQLVMRGSQLRAGINRPSGGNAANGEQAAPESAAPSPAQAPANAPGASTPTSQQGDLADDIFAAAAEPSMPQATATAAPPAGATPGAGVTETATPNSQVAHHVTGQNLSYIISGTGADRENPSGH